MSNFNQPLGDQPAPAMQDITTFFRRELETSNQMLQQENPQTPNLLLGNSPVSAPTPFEPPLIANDLDHLTDICFSPWDVYCWSPPLLKDSPQRQLMPEKSPKLFLAVMEVHKPMTAENLRVSDITGSNIPDDPEQKLAVCRALFFSNSFLAADPGKHVLKVCSTGNGGDGPDLDATSAGYVFDVSVIKQLWLSAKDKSLSDLISQVQADLAKKHGKEAEAEFLKMVDICPREVIAKFDSVEIWDLLTLEDKVKEEFAKLRLCTSTPEIIDCPPPAVLNHPLPAFNYKPSSSIPVHEGGVKFFLVPDLNEIYVEDESGGSTVPSAMGDDEKATSKKRKAEATGGGGERHDHMSPNCQLFQRN